MKFCIYVNSHQNFLRCLPDIKQRLNSSFVVFYFVFVL